MLLVKQDFIAERVRFRSSARSHSLAMSGFPPAPSRRYSSSADLYAAEQDVYPQRPTYTAAGTSFDEDERAEKDDEPWTTSYSDFRQSRAGSNRYSQAAPTLISYVCLPSQSREVPLPRLWESHGHSSLILRRVGQIGILQGFGHGRTAHASERGLAAR